jgi:hypothetical protein
MTASDIDAEIRGELNTIREWADLHSDNNIDRAIHLIEGMELATRLREETKNRENRSARTK